MADPVGDAESAEFGEMPAVKPQQEMAWLLPQALEHVPVTLREIPNIAGFKIVGGGCAIRRDHCRTYAAFQHVGPFGGDGMPVELAECAGFQAHGDTRDALGDGEFFYSCFFG